MFFSTKSSIERVDYEISRITPNNPLLPNKIILLGSRFSP
jgi:hypothetical protein